MQKILNSVVVREGNKLLAFHFTYTCTHRVLQYFFFFFFYSAVASLSTLERKYICMEENGYDVFFGKVYTSYMLYSWFCINYMIIYAIGAEKKSTTQAFVFIFICYKSIV